MTSAIPSLAIADPPGQTAGGSLGTYSVGRIEIPLTATGGIGAPYTWELVPGLGTLPNGIALRSDVVFGVPPTAGPGLAGIATTPGTYVFTLRVFSGAEFADQQYSITVSSLVVADPDRLPDATVLQPYAYTLKAFRDGTQVAALWTPLGAMPQGITLGSNGTIEVASNASAGVYDIAFTVNDGIDTVGRHVSLGVSEIDIPGPSVLPNASQGAAYTASFTAAGGSGSYSYTISGSSGGLTFDGTTGLLSGTISAAPGPFAFSITATDTSMPARSFSKRFSIDVLGVLPVPPLVTATSGVLTDCSVGVPCNRSIAMSFGGVAPYAWSAQGLPPGLEVRSAVGMASGAIEPGDAELWGTATAAGLFTITLTVTDANGTTSSAAFTLAVSPLLQTNSLLPGTIETPYSKTLRVIGGSPGYVAFQTGGLLPAGLAFDGSGTLSGTPHENGDFSFTAQFADSTAQTLRALNSLSIAGAGGSSIVISTDGSLGTIPLGTAYSKQLVACCPLALTWSVQTGTSSLPSGLAVSPDGILSGTPTAIGTFVFMIRAANPSNPLFYGQRQFTLAVGPSKGLTLTPTIVWNVDADGFWDVASNWRDTKTNSSRVPTSSDDVLIDRGAANPIVTIRTSQSVRAVLSREPIVLTGSLTISAASELDGDLTLAGALVVNGPLTLGGQTTWSSGGLSGSQRLTNTGALTLAGTGTKSLVDFNLDNAGTMVQAGGDLSLGNNFGGGSTLRNLTGGTYEFRGDGGVVNGNGDNSTPHHFDNAGTLLKSSGTGTSRLTMFSFKNTGTIDVRTGTVQLGGSRGIVNTGTFKVSAGGTIDLTGGADLSYQGNFSGTGLGRVLLQNGVVRLTSPATLNMSPGLFQWIGGGIEAFGTTVTNLGAITLAGTARKDFGGALSNSGVIQVKDGGSLELSFQDASLRTGTFTNLATGVVDFQADGGVSNRCATSSCSNGAGTITSSGTFRKSGGSGTSTIAAAFNATNAIVDVVSGTFSFTAGGTVTGAFFSVSSGAVEFTSATPTFVGTLTGIGAGTLRLNSGIRTGAGGATFDFPSPLLQWTAGDLTAVSGALTNAGVMTFAGSNNRSVFGFLTNTGVITHASVANLLLANDGSQTGSTLTNQAGALFVFNGDGGITNGNGDNGSPHLVRNLGTIRKLTGTVISVLNPFTVVNDGTIDARTGTIRLGGRSVSSSTGSFTVSAGATIELTGATDVTYSGTFTGSGQGRVLLQGGLLRAQSGPLALNMSPGLFQWTGGGIQAFNSSVSNLGSITLSGSATKNLGGTLNNSGTIVHQGTGQFELSFQDASLRPGQFNNLATGVYDIQGDGSIGSQLTATSVSNAGLLKKSGGALTSSVLAAFSNTGTVEVRAGTLTLTQAPSQRSGTTLTAGTWNVFAGSTLGFPAGANVVTNNANIFLSGVGSQFAALGTLAANGGRFEIRDGRSFTTSGSLNNTGRIALGVSSTLTVSGAYTQSATSTLDAEIGGSPSSSQFGKLGATGSASLAGTFDAILANGFGPSKGDVFPIVTSASRSGVFGTLNGLTAAGVTIFEPNYGATNFTLTAPLGAADLGIANVEVLTPTASPGQNVSIRYTVSNRGGATAAAEWYDSIYLSTDSFLDPSDVLVGRVHRVGAIGGLGSYTETVTAPLQAVAERVYRAIVLLDSRTQVPDADRTNNIALSSGTVAVAVPILNIGGSVTGTVASGQDLYYKMVVPPGANVTVSSTYAVAAQAELDIRYGAPPDRTNFDEQAFDVNAGGLQQMASLGDAPSGDYYVLLHGRDAAAAGRSFTISAAAAQLQVVKISPDRVVQKANVTVTLQGSRFSSQTRVSLVQGSQNIEGTSVFASDSSHLRATFDLTSAFGDYIVRVEDSGESADASTALSVSYVALGGPVNISILAPAMVRVGEPIPVSITVTSDFGVAPVPVVVVNATGVAKGQESTQFLDPQLPRFALPNIPASFVKLYDPFPHAAHQFSYFDVSLVNLDAQMDWDAEKGGLRPAGVPSDAWDAIWSNLRPRLGNTAGDFYTRLWDTGSGLLSAGTRTKSVKELFAFETRQANNEFTPTPGAPSIDVASPAPGMSLVFGRSYASTIAGRFTNGRLGRGWVDNLDISASTDASSNVVIRQGALTRYFNLLLTGDYGGPPGEHGTLSLTNGVYVLREIGGGLTAFRTDGRVDYLEDTNGNRLTAGYSGSLLTSLTHSNGSTLRLTYNQVGRIAQVTDAVGRTATYSYDPAGEHLVGVATSAGTVQYTYTAESSGPRAHALASVTSPADTHVFFEYDTQGRLASQQRDSGAEKVTYAYDRNFSRVTDAQGHTALAVYDEFGQVRLAESPTGQLGEVDFDDAHNVIDVEVRGGGTSKFDHDARGNFSRITDPLGGTQVMTHEPTFSQLADWTDPLGHRLAFGHDLHGNATSTTYPDGSVEQFEYDVQGNLTRSVDRLGQGTTSTYAASGLLKSVSLPDGSTIDYTYDNRNNLLSAADMHGTIAMEYDQSDRMIKISYPNGRFLSFTYDAGGRRIKSVDQSGFATNYAYDVAGRLARLTDSSGSLVVAYSYDEVGRMGRKDAGNGTYTTYTYDPSSRLTGITNIAPDESTLSQFLYTYDALGRRDSMTTLEGKTTYGYDLAGQLTSVTLPNGRNITYQYDAAGNRTSVTDNGVTTSYSTNELNEYFKIGDTLQLFDRAGNMTTKIESSGSTLYSYDSLNRLAGVTTPTGTWSYEYDALGNRVAMVHNGQRREYLIDPAGLGNVVGEYDGTGRLVAHYTHGFGLASRVDGSDSAAYYDTDAVGSVIGITGSSGSYINRYSYLPFGELLTSVETTMNAFRHNGAFGVQDDGSGLSYMRARFYDPGSGRFVQPDPIGLSGGSNAYSFASGNPLSLADPSGLDPSDSGHVLFMNILFNGKLNVPDALGETYVDEWVEQQELWANLPPPPRIESHPSLGGSGGRPPKPNPLMNRIGIPGGIPTHEAEKAMAKIEKRLARRAFLKAVGRSLSGLIGGALSGRLALGVWADGVHLAVYGKLPPCDGPEALYGKLGAPHCDFQKGVGTFEVGRQKTEQGAPGDPNFISGPAGFGPDNYVVGQGSWPYVIGYENKASANAPAQQVVITNTLDSNLDLNTFQLGGFGFGDLVVDVPAGRQFYGTRIDYRSKRGVFVDVTAELKVATRTVTWTLTSIDPATLDVPASVLSGFLPPNVTAPEGDGFVTYSVQPKADLRTGTRISAKASIVFDTNAPEATNIFTNTIDAGSPSSRASTGSATSDSASFVLSWSGTDDGDGALGSGIASYTIYASKDGGPFSPFVSSTTDTSATFTGEPGHAYAFYSLALDNVGHFEPAKTIAEATTTIQPLDRTAPVLSVPGTTFVEAVTSAGASASFVVTATDETDGAVTPVCTPESGSPFPFGTTTVTCSATDRAGNRTTKPFDILVRDTTPPSMSVPSAIAIEAADRGGSVVTFSATAADLVDGVVATHCTPDSGTLFAVATTTVTCSATDAHSNTATGTFTVLVRDTAPPVLSGVPNALVIEATSGSGATVSWISPTALDVVDGVRSATCSPGSGSTFALGDTTVSCLAADAAGNTASASFVVAVRDTTPPLLTLPANMALEATSSAGATVTFVASATDVVDGAMTVHCVPESGSLFSIAATTVSCSATDQHGNSATGTFSVQVRDNAPPVLSGVPSDLVIEATGPAGADVNWSMPSALDTVEGARSVSCVPDSGATFALGSTTVRCSAADASGNSSSASFVVTVVDTTAPRLTLPASTIAEATGPGGAAVTFAPSATDTVDGLISAQCTPSSGATFPIATTTVTCSATDRHGNAASGAFTVTVQDTTPPTLTNMPASVAVESLGPAGTPVSWPSPTAADVVDGTVAVTCSPSSASAFGLGVATVSCSAADAHGNQRQAQFSVTVRDTTPPSITPTVFGTLGGNGWYVGDVQVAWSVTDSGSSISASTGCEPVVLTADNPGTALTCHATSAGGTGSASTTVKIDRTPPSIGTPPNQTAQQTGATTTVLYSPPIVTDSGSGVASASCAPSSGSSFPVGVTTVTCTAADLAGNTTSTSFSVTVTPVSTATPDGRMFGAGHIDEGRLHHHFAFRVSQVNNQDYGRLEYWVNTVIRAGRDDDDEREARHKGDRDDDYRRDHHRPVNSFEATFLTSVIFSSPSTTGGSRFRGVSGTARLAGSGLWNGRPGYTFEASATDDDESGHHRDTFWLVVKDPGGHVVVDLSGDVDGGGIEFWAARE